MTTVDEYCQHLNDTRYRGQKEGFYESFFQRANHPTRPLAFWIRYTIFSPKHHPERALGELWAMVFNSETGEHVAVKQEVPFHQCRFDRSAFHVQVANAMLQQGLMRGEAVSSTNKISWDLQFSSDQPPLLFMPFWMYTSKFPPAKGLVGMPMATYRGTLTLNGTPIDINGWTGSQNHNWGTKHTDHYAWGQVAGFDSHPDSFLEMISARLKKGGMWWPFLTMAVLRHRGETYEFNRPLQLLRSRAAIHASEDAYTLSFKTRCRHLTLSGTIDAPKHQFVGLPYYNPPGGIKYCLNSKIAACTLQLTDDRTKKTEVLHTSHRAAFEIITDDPQHGVKMMV